MMLTTCLLGLLLFTGVETTHDWPQWLGPQRDGVLRETGLLEKFPAGGPKLLWKSPIGGGYAGPAVAEGRVYVSDMKYDPGIKKSENDFDRRKLGGKETIYCLDSQSGKEIWKHSYPCSYDISYAYGPRCTPVVHDGKVYSLGAMGDLFCLAVGDGKVLWSHHFPKEYGLKSPTWGWSASPLLDGDKLICLVGGKGTTAVAFHKDTGKELWRALSSGPEPGYCPPVIFTLAGKRQLIIWHPKAVNGLDPETGKVFWSQPFDVKANLTVPMPRELPGDRLFVTSFYNGPMMLKITPGDPPQAKVLWKGTSDSETRTDKLHSIMPTPFIQDEHIYGVCSYGQLRCLKASTGERVWETLEATGVKRPARWANAFLIRLGETNRYFLFNEQGVLILATLSPQGYRPLGQAKLIEPTQAAMGRDIVWTHPAFAQRCIFVRNDQEIACYSLSK
jgi:outer membrane protein assembly factor BamB